MIKKILLPLLVPTTLFTLTTSCSQTHEEHYLSSIQIQLPTNSISVEVNETYKSEQIDVRCYDNYGQIIECETNLLLTNEDGTMPPSWIFINDNNQIEIKGNLLPSNFKFYITAYDADTHKIKSDTQILNVEIYKKPLLAPDEIKIQCDSLEHLVFFGQDGNIQMDIKATIDGKEREDISKECQWTITHMFGPVYDSDLFSLSYDDQSCHLQVNKEISDEHKGIYNIDIKAVSNLNPNASDEISLSVDLEDGLNYCIESKGYYFTRKSFYDTWTLSSLNPKVSVIYDVPETIYDIPVTKVRARLCSQSNVTKLGVLKLPKTITTIGEEAFLNQSYLYTVSFPGAKFVMDNAFNGCIHINFNNVDDEPSLNYVGNQAFYNCSSIKFTKEHDLFYVGEKAFAKSSIESLDLGDNIEQIGAEAFSDCNKLKKLTIRTSQPPALAGALYFGSTTNLSTIEIPKLSMQNYLDNELWAIYKDKLVEIQ